ncbi:tRNA pseudouridine(55) synthase TruB [Parvibacter caecicola]|uniref:tRNA pseudouridine(55) synthase TruB n=1 Tax=Parvibacter caecicola TaxID=747645 RepID=UPI0023F05C55|nr:tRNA pseudouridine(55) synthase TruB [Parvibacter caecicola]
MKRQPSEFSLVIAIDKPSGMSSHDVVNRVRRIFGERRVGHTGTLDPLASGVLQVCVGPAARLDKYLVDHDKRYEVLVRLGVETDTDDALGQVIRTAPVPCQAANPHLAQEFLRRFEGFQNQMPPLYSAIKVNGAKACDAARKGRVLQLQPRPVEVYSLQLLAVEETEYGLFWRVACHVSKGTYIRSLARDIGAALGCGGSVEQLRRLAVGRLTEAQCVSLKQLEECGAEAALDPLALLGLRFLFADEHQEKSLANGGKLSARSPLYQFNGDPFRETVCACMPRIRASEEPLADGEVVAVVSGGLLRALYRFSQEKGALVPDCVFSQGVRRGRC